jgi:hypothetical protein
MDDQPLTAKFPDLQPGQKPSLGMTYGIGTSLVGRRDFDAETGTYVTTHCFHLLFVPLFALGAYRVADAPGGGWYCLGKVPLSGFARIWNVVLVLAIIGAAGGIWWTVHTRSPEYVAGQKLKEADQAAAAGQGGQAAKLCREVMDSKTPKAEEAKQKLAGFMANPPGPPSEAAAVYGIAVDLHRENRCPVANLFESGKTVAERFADVDPSAALDLLEVIAPFAPDAEGELAVRRELLEKLYARNPNDPDAASRLAAACEAKGDRQRCEKLLAPFEAQLGTRDGAAILGRIYASRGEYDRAHALLRPFVDANLPAYRGAIAEVQGARKRVIDSLNTGKAPGFDYDRARRLPEAQQDAMANDYVTEQLRSDPALRDARKRLMAGRGAAAAAFDLGVVQLQRGQAMADPAARKAELEAAEQTFLSIRGFAGEEADYKLTLGQVYYWLGRQAEGKKLFDELLAGAGRSAEVVVTVANTLRDLGDYSEARRMAEDAYGKETDARKKHQLANFRALLRTDVDDEILWRSRSNTEDPHVRAGLAHARGNKAEQDGKDGEAADHYRRAIEIYDKLPENESTLNNSALVHFALFAVTHDRAEFTRGADKLDRAIALQPSDSILLTNGAGTVLGGALRDVAGQAVDFRVLKQAAEWEALPYLYRGPTERAAVFDRLTRHPGTVKARAYAEKLMILAPKRSDSYATLAAILEYARDLDGLKAVLARLEKADLDLGDSARETRERLSGKSDAKKIDEARKALARAETALAAAKGRKDRTFAVAAGRYVRAKQSAWEYGEAVDADELVKLAEEAHAAVPSDGTEATLLSALRFRAHVTLARDNPEYAKLADKTKRSLDDWLIYYVLAGDGPLRAKAAANADVKRLAALRLEALKLDPDAVGPTVWVVVRAVNPSEAAAVAEKVKANERPRVRRKIERLLAPLSSHNALDESLALQLEGKDADAKKVLVDLAAKGIPLP